MLDVKLFASLLLGKIVKYLTRQLKIGGGTAAPGLFALYIDPNLIKKLAKNILQGSIVITGTNGKTTTSRMLSEILKKEGLSPMHNRAGSNLLRGIASTLCEEANLLGKITQDIAIWEVDEAAMPQAILATKPKVVVVTNLFRDQLDRYGEIDKLKKLWQESLKKTSATLILNSDDPAVAHLGHQKKGQVIYFGLSDKKQGRGSLPRIADAKYCPSCATPLSYQVVYASHMGDYRCSKCDHARPQPQVTTDKITKLEPDRAEFILATKNKEAQISLAVGGLYNIYNALAAAACAYALEIKSESIKFGLSSFKAAFGRVEKIKINGKTLSLYLVKNPTGFNEVINTLFSKNTKRTVLIAINDKIADGRDVSWLWDVDFEKIQGKLKFLTITGIRAQDLALRLKYAGITNNTYISNNFEKAIQTVLRQKDKNIYLLPTYTAMLEIRKALNKVGFGVKFWED